MNPYREPALPEAERSFFMPVVVGTLGGLSLSAVVIFLWMLLP